MARPGSDAVNSAKYISLPKLNVSQTAEAYGFTNKVLFPDKNVAKFVKVLPSVKKEKKQVLISKDCILEGGRLVSAYDKSMLETLIQDLNIQDKFVFLGIANRNHIDEKHSVIDDESYIYENGWPGIEVGKECPFMYESDNFPISFVYNIESKTLNPKGDQSSISK